MDPLAIFFLLVLLVLIVLFILRPFLGRSRIRNTGNNREISSLLAERERILTAIQELDFDQSLGKIPAEDYPIQRAALVQKGADVLRRLDSLTPNLPEKGEGRPRLSQAVSEKGSPVSDDELEDLLSRRRNLKKEKTAGFCPKCGKPVLKSDVFCPACGNPLVR